MTDYIIISDEEMFIEFEKAANVILPKLMISSVKPSKGELLDLYARYKFVTCGPACQENRPSLFNFKGRAKFDAWAELSVTVGMTRIQAMSEYILMVNELEQKQRVDPNFSGNDEQSNGEINFSKNVSIPLIDNESTTDHVDSIQFEEEWKNDLIKIIECDLSETSNDALDRLALQTTDSDLSFKINGDHLTPLHLACDKGKVEIVEWLMKSSSVDVNTRDKFQQTPLHYASSCGHSGLVHMLIQKLGADFDLVDEDGCKPYDVAYDQLTRDAFQM